MANTQFKLTEVMPGCMFVEHENISFLCGCPSEVIKVLKLKKMTMPTRIVLPANFYQYGIVQAALEFPVYDFLFFQGRYFKGEKLTIIGTAKQVVRIRNILSLTLLGPTFEQMQSWGVDSATQIEIRNIGDYMALPILGSNPKKVAQIDDLINFVVFDESGDQPTATVDGVQIAIHSSNRFSFLAENTEEVRIDINIREPQRPPMPIPHPETLVPRSTFGATALSKLSTGVDEYSYTSGLLLALNGLVCSVDGVAWGKEHLRILGVNPHELDLHIVTHIHDDHCNVIDLVANGKVFPLLSDQIGYCCLVQKIAWILDHPYEEVAKYIELIRVELMKPFNWHGATFVFWRAPHPIPTLGFSATVNDKTIVVTGDMAWGQKLTKMYEAGAVTKELHDFIQNVFFLESDLTFADAGGNKPDDIHPDINELAMLPAQIRKVMVATHRPGIPPHLATKFQPVSPGQSWVLIPDQQWDTNTYMAVKRAPILAKISDQWFSVVLHQGVIKDLPAGYEVLKFGCEGKDFYIIIAGTVKVSDGDGVKAILSTGEFFGEISAQYGSPCNATIETLSPVRLLAIRKEIFRELVAKTGKLQWLNTIHNMRPVLMKIHQLREMSTAALHQLFAVAKMEQYEAGEIIIAEGDEADRMFGIIHGKVEVWHQNGHGPELLATLTESDLFGEVALWKKGRRTATVKAVTDLQVFSIAKKDFDRVCEEIPVFGLMIGKLVEERSL